MTDGIQITSFNTSLPLTLQAHSALGYIVCMAAMLGIYYTNAWDAKSQPFMSTRLRSEDGSAYPIAKVFTGGVLNKEALEKYGIPRLTGSFAYAMFMANAAVSLILSSCFVPPLTFPDRRPHCALLPLLGRRRCQGLQERKDGPPRRPPPRSHGQALQGGAMVVVHCHSGPQLRPRPHRRHHPEHHLAGVGVCCLAAAGHFHCAFGKGFSPVSLKGHG